MFDSKPSTCEVLLIDDDDEIRELLSGLFSSADISLQTTGNLMDGMKFIQKQQPSLILLDLTLPDGDGMEFCARLRAEGFTGAIMMLTARGDTRDRIEGLEGGADDYLAKPFESRELFARVRNLLRRPARAQGGSSPFRFAKFGDWRLDLVHRRLLTPDDRIVVISTSEFDILNLMIHSPHTELSREQLVPERKETVHLDRSLDNRISRLRQKLSTHAGETPVILTVRNRGFMLAKDVIFE